MFNIIIIFLNVRLVVIATRLFESWQQCYGTFREKPMCDILFTV